MVHGTSAQYGIYIEVCEFGIRPKGGTNLFYVNENCFPIYFFPALNNLFLFALIKNTKSSKYQQKISIAKLSILSDKIPVAFETSSFG